jgi:large subunit ribosomal protein L9
MQIILLERVPKLGQMGEVVTVRDGFARNFLIPNGKALRATKAALADFEKKRKDLELRNIAAKRDAEQLSAQIAGRSATILRQASESGALYGSVSARDIAAAFADVGISFDRSQVRIEQPIKALGLHEVAIALHPEVEVTVKVNVARSAEEAAIQAGEVKPPSAADEAAEELAGELADLEAELRAAGL